MAFLLGLFGGNKGNSAKITTDVVSSVAMTVAASTVSNCSSTTETNIFSDNIHICKCKNNIPCKIKVGTTNVNQLVMMTPRCLQDAASKMSDKTDIASSVAASLKNVSDGLSKAFDAFSKDEKTSITNKFQSYIKTEFSDLTSLDCKIDSGVNIASGSIFTGCTDIEIGDSVVKNINQSTQRCVQNKKGNYEATQKLTTTIQDALDRETTSIFGWMTDIAKQFAMVAAAAVIVGGLVLILKKNNDDGDADEGDIISNTLPIADVDELYDE
jgi:hypothetical protein